MSVRISQIISHLELIAPSSYQESYDNSRLIVGDSSQEVSNVLLCLDSIEEVVDEAVERGCQLIIAHHPIIFGGLKSLTGKNYIERVVIKAIKHNIAIYACHTNLDNVFAGVNYKIGEKLGISNLKILSPKNGLLQKLIFYVPISHQEIVRQAIFDAGAGQIGNYDECSFNTEGIGTFRGNENTDAFVGEKGRQHHEREMKIEVVLPKYKAGSVVAKLLEVHPYEEVAYDLYDLSNSYSEVGSGMIGELDKEMETTQFLRLLKEKMGAGCVKYTNIHKPKVKKIAFCGGSGSFLLKQAIARGADVFITGDFKYHEFFDSENKIMIADIGHFESEQYTIDLFEDILKENFREINFIKTSINTNPVNYL